MSEKIFWDEEFDGSCRDGQLLRSSDSIKTLIQLIKASEDQGSDVVGIKLSMDKNMVRLIQVIKEEVTNEELI